MLEQIKDLSTVTIGDTLTIDYGSKNINTRSIGEVRGIVDNVYVCKRSEGVALVYDMVYKEYLEPLVKHGYLFRQVRG